MINLVYTYEERTNRLHYFLSIYFDNYPLHVSNRFTAYHQEVLLYIQQLVYGMRLR